MRAETWVIAAFILIGTGIAIGQCSQWNSRTRAAPASPSEVVIGQVEGGAQDTFEDSESQALKRQWDRVDALCLRDPDELVRARNCALRQQFERELARKNLCRTSESWVQCPGMGN